MKTISIIKRIRLTLGSAFLLTLISYAQNLPVANFSYTVGVNGQVNFESTSTNTTSNMMANWKFGNSNWVNNALSVSHTFTANGSYAVVIAIVNQNQVILDSTTKSVQINGLVTGVPENLSHPKLNLYPNPVGNTNTINLLTGDTRPFSLRIYNALGSVVTMKELATVKENHTVELNVEDLDRGVYFVSVTYSDKVNRVIRFIKE